MCAGGFNVWGALVFSALPFATVQALADSDLGKKLRVRRPDICLTTICPAFL